MKSKDKRRFHARRRAFPGCESVEAGKTLEVLVDYGEKHLSLGSVTVPETGIPAGRLTIFSLGYEFPQRIAEDLSANGTANTYLITKPGTTYKFRATTKGNGRRAPTRTR